MHRSAPLLALLLLLAAPAAAQQTLVVTSTADPGDGACDVIGTGDGCTLREAITAANATTEVDQIHFAIPSSGVQTIQPTSTLPNITQPVVLDGYTQLGASPNTLTVGSDAVLLVEIDGSQAGNVSGLQLTNAAHGSIVRGLIVNNFQDVGISTIDVANLRIEGNFVGTDASGTVARGNRVGIRVSRQGTANTTIGGPEPAQRNLASGNTGAGIEFGGGNPAFPAATDITVQGNYVGTDASGLGALPNGGSGIFVGDVADRTFVGGPGPGEGNVVAGNLTYGIYLSSSTTGGAIAFNVTVQGNLVGVGADGSTPLGNGRDGIVVPRSGHLIGGSEAGAGNVVAYNGFHPEPVLRGVGIFTSATEARIEGNTIYSNWGDGILVQSLPGVGNVRITANAIYDSANPDWDAIEVGINLQGCGEFNTDHRSPNDPGDDDEGPNRCQNYPVLASVGVAGPGTSSDGDLIIAYSVDTAPANATYPLTVEFFLADGEEGGAVYLGSDTYTADDFGTGTPGEKTVNLGLAADLGFAAGDAVVATAIDAEGNTSEFSPMPVVAVANEVGAGTRATTLLAPYPNPMRGTATVAFHLAKAGPVRLGVYDVLGREVMMLNDAAHPAGRHEAVLDGRALSAGMYVVRLTTEDGKEHTCRLTILR